MRKFISGLFIGAAIVSTLYAIPSVIVSGASFAVQGRTEFYYDSDTDCTYMVAPFTGTSVECGGVAK